LEFSIERHNTDGHNKEELLIPATGDLSSIRATSAAGFHLTFVIEVFASNPGRRIAVNHNPPFVRKGVP
jgi:hypothetical protein